MVVNLTYEEYLNIPSLRNQYNDTIAKCHLHNYGCIYIETINNTTDVMEIEDVEMLRNGVVEYV
ncbi:hypothetical protein CWE04_11575 [Thomasclavelia cocleata]|uniref:Uncharacterized protein n=1 Tax=Thomasclavelia cocleata TaxID=69824 RepID=A0A1I0GBX0_9FIRM|nr:hypothetical protein [Thomasclavelia cocleata]MCR1959836.1 hypothetical protein [Thomasclavelia cocleata]NDO43186.1 hypothetical protein [Thomasclavelia cocleata]PJN79842.1 hypothetical protein CWE04_11575 [Thomasclavelia cocleata]SET68383.1 hypothetical protein SAMN04489758_12811 [Thomasclavelia cocleata]